MLTYKVAVTTGCLAQATTKSCVYIKLVGRQGQSGSTRLHSFLAVVTNYIGFTHTYDVKCPSSLGELVLIELDKKATLSTLCGDDWFPSKIEVTSPEGDIYHFPIHRWITDKQTYQFREGKAMLCFEDKHPLAKRCREEELILRKLDYQWYEYAKGIPHCVKAENPKDLPPEVQFSFTKGLEFVLTAAKSLVELRLEAMAHCKHNWDNIESIAKVRTTEISEYVRKHWTEDAFFGYQYLNGVNPIWIRRISALPDNLPVTKEKLGCWSLDEEMKNGNIFLCDYKILHGVEPHVIDDKKQHLAAPLVLLHSTPDHKLMPIAIQLKQKPSEDNPIFLPSDSEHDWLMAKIFVRGADFPAHQLNTHLLRTHLLAEVFALSLLRNVPMVHPLYKLLIPHTRYTLHINSLARDALISDTGFFNTYAASGGTALLAILQRSTASLTYRSLCIPEDISDRGMESIPGYYYREDGLKLWDIIHKFVEGIIGFYYKTDDCVQKDCELQKWIQDIFEHGFLSQASSGVPQSLNSVKELVKLVTMVIFTCSAQHSAVNSGQFDYGGWMPNTPVTLRRPHPATVNGTCGSSAESTMLQTLPDMDTTVQGMAAMFTLSKQSSDFVGLGHYPEEHFTEQIPLGLMKHFKKELGSFSADVQHRNLSLDVPYTYLDPKVVANSVAI